MAKFLFSFVLIPLLLISKLAMCNGFDSVRFPSGRYQNLTLGNVAITDGHNENLYNNLPPNCYELPVSEQYMGYSKSSDKLIAPTPALIKNTPPVSIELLVPRVSIVKFR